ncbi:Oidioi.mRNA.OKI2018_I69.XSR.g14900.t1.cds [Oikopleura dioica]|uniref:Oidioi.mRNA.OKI2018_I69.XSR.g14900.t1.cds n=1 Tax=Oikopleura dioica TaxID=34765 RepID=A0ABN7SG63_OIKDI|nr:Oidioi.mRNA.OKI2018_I69.XSR.g14900.t1.cds [Oikopleura dioica]
MLEAEVLDAYRSIFAQTFSRNGSTLYIGDNLGKITTYNVTRWSKTQEFQTQLHSILFILEYKGILIAGGIGGLVTLILSEEGRISNGKRITSESYNTALILEDQDVLIGGGPRGILYTIDLNVFHIIKEDIDSHKDAIQCSSMSIDRGIFCTASEDGLVHIWDIKSQEITRTILPYENEELNRPERGRFISCCSMIGDWLICGGGPRVGLWHVSSGELANILDIEEDVPLSMLSSPERIFVGGSRSVVYQFQRNGSKISTVEATSQFVYSIQKSLKGHMLVSGSTRTVDIYKNNYKAQELSV